MEKRIVIAGSCRTPVGKAGATPGNLSSFSAVELLALCFSETNIRIGKNGGTRFTASFLEQVIAGCVAQSSDAPNIARVAALKAGIPLAVPAFTVQRNCGSGLQALVSACQMIKAEEAQIVLTGGSESMSNIPHILREARFGLGLRHGQLVDALWEGLTDPITGEMMGQTAENIAVRYGISREDQDKFAAASHQKAFKAMREGKFRSQIYPLEVGDKKIFLDEGINPGLTPEFLALYPAKAFFVKNGTVHAGNSCGISDGASSFLTLNLDKALAYGITPEAEVVSYAFEACEPSYMGMGPYYAIPKALTKAKLTADDIDFFEINEAFAVQTIACQRELGIPSEKLNVWGGAIALGHPVGATGAILITKLMAILKETGKHYGMVSMCIGGGQGGALILRRW